MKKQLGLYRHLTRGISCIVLAAFWLQLSPLQAVGQTGSRSLLSRLAAGRANALKVSFTYNPRLPTEGQSVKFMDTSTGSPISRQWDFGDGSTSIEQNPVHVFTKAGFRKVTLVATNGVGSKRALKTITIVPAPATASFVFSPSSPKAGQIVQFADTSLGDPTSWLWSFGDGSTSTTRNPSHVFAASGSYTVTLTATNNTGSKTSSQTVKVEVALAASFTYSPALPTAGQAVQFTDASTGSLTSWQWYFGDGTSSTAQNPSHAFASAGSYSVTLTVMNAAGQNSVTKTVTVASASTLVASFAYSPASPTVGQAVAFTDGSIGGPTSWSWVFGDGSTSTAQNPSHTYTTAGSKTVTLTASNISGKNSISKTVAVVAALAASYTYSPASPVVDQAVKFTDASTGSPTSWAWDFNDGTTSTLQNPSRAFVAAGSYSVTLIASNASTSSNVVRVVTVVPKTVLLASFTYSPASPLVDQAVQFTDTSTGNPAVWIWDFGDGATSALQNPSHTYAAAGAKAVTLTVSNGEGSSSIGQAVTVSAIPPADTYKLPEGRAMDWSSAGVWYSGVKGIPDYPVGIAVNTTTSSHQYYCDPTGVTDCTTKLRAAISACPAYNAVYMPPGTYKISSPLTFPTGVALRGAGPGVTTIRMAASGNMFEFAGSGSPTPYSITSGYTKGSSSIVVSSGSWAAGDMAIINQLNDPTVPVSQTGYGTGTWLGIDGTNGTRVQGEILVINGVIGSAPNITLTLNRPLSWTYLASLIPYAYRLAASGVKHHCGIENLTAEYASGATDGHALYLNRIYHCWAKKVEFKGVPRNCVYPNYYTHGYEIRQCYMHDAPEPFESGMARGIFALNGSSYALIENNVMNNQHVGIEFEGYASGNVIGYNYVRKTWHEGGAAVSAFYTHGAYPFMNLYEGNATSKIFHDNYWGNSGYNVSFRNNYTGNDYVSDWNVHAIQVEQNCRYTSFIGNVIGYVGIKSSSPLYYFELIPSLDNGDFTLWAVGQDFQGEGAVEDPLVASTMIRHANYDYIREMVEWKSGQVRALQNSLYYDSKPSWFGSLTWPPIGPDVSGYVQDIPAKRRWDAYVASGNIADLFY